MAEPFALFCESREELRPQRGRFGGRAVRFAARRS
jgi:hypothetical protein